jgi:dTDP-4-dehydrorhamnose reductase
MQTLITGGAGLLGNHLIRLAPTPFALTATQRTTPVNNAPAVTIDLANASAVNQMFDDIRPELVIHTAYGMNQAMDIVAATRNVATACAATGARLIHISTDALFDGLHAPYHESDSPSPITQYGRWKAEAEDIVQRLVLSASMIRTSLITEFAPLDPRSVWVATALRQRDPITLFVDELRCPITPHDLAMQIWEVAQLPIAHREGVWHLVGPEVVSRYTLGVLIAAHEGLDPGGITPALTDPLVRPRDLRLTTSRADQFLITRPRPISTLLLDRLKSASS